MPGLLLRERRFGDGAGGAGRDRRLDLRAHAVGRRGAHQRPERRGRIGRIAQLVFARELDEAFGEFLIERRGARTRAAIRSRTARS